MSGFALTIVLAAAVLHASWNALVKAAPDRALTIAAVATSHMLLGLVLIALFPSPAPASWPSLAISTVVHFAYYILMFQAYRLGDLSQVYPISRGIAPVLVTIGAFAVLGETLSPTGMAAVGLITLGIMTLAFQRGLPRQGQRAIGVALLLGLSIAAYSVADGVGVRWSGSPMGYAGWLFFLEAPVVAAILLWRRSKRIAFDWKTYGIGLLGGVFAVTAYGTVLYAKTIAPVGAVSAVRESSVIIAALIGVVFFGERPWGRRLLAAIIVAAGVILLASSG